MLSIRGLYKSYNGKDDVLKDVSLEVEAGDIFAFIGHNGAGKTTLIKCMVGLLEFEKGEIYIDGINVKDTMLVLYIPVAWFLALKTNLDIVYIFLIVRLIDIIKAIVGIYFLKKGTWLVNITIDKKDATT